MTGPATPSKSPPPTRPGINGLPEAFTAYAIWGFMPVFFKQLQGIAPIEVVAHRILWSLGLLLAILWWRGRLGEYRTALGTSSTRRLMLLSASLIAGNWLVYIWAIDNNQIVAASLGYYLNPLFNVMLGMIFFRERLSRTQWIAVALAAFGVAVLAWESLHTIWISIALAGTFGLYGLVRKSAPVGALPGLTIETTLLFPIALGYALWASNYDVSPGWGYSAYTDSLLVFGGALTALPLLLFASAARKMPLSTLGFVQYIGPTIQFLLGIFAYHEPFTQAHAICFGLIWTSLALYSFDSWRMAHNARAARAAA